MVFRRVNAEQYAALVEFCMEHDISYELKTAGKTALLFGLSLRDWRTIDYGALAFV